MPSDLKMALMPLLVAAIVVTIVIRVALYWRMKRGLDRQVEELGRWWDDFVASYPAALQGVTPHAKREIRRMWIDQALAGYPPPLPQSRSTPVEGGDDAE